MMRIEPTAAEWRAQPMQLRDVPDDEHEGDHACRPLQCVAHVAHIGVGTDVGQAVGDDDEPDHRVEDHRQKNERPLDRHQQRSQRVDHVHAGLKRPRPAEHRSIREQVNDQKGADWHEPGQREQAVDEKLVTGKK